MAVSLLLHARAEIVFAVFIVVRNRTVRLAFLLSLTLIAMSMLEKFGPTPNAERQITVFLIAGSLAAVVASRLLAPGGALAASRQVAARFWLVPLGRLSGGILVLVPVVAIAAFSLDAATVSPLHLSLVATVFSAGVGSAVMTLSPAVGGSAAAIAGLVSVWVGVLTPTDVLAVFERWPLVQRAIALIWHVGPLQWRASRLLDQFQWIDAMVLVGWFAIGVVLVGWATTPVRFNGNRCSRPA